MTRSGKKERSIFFLMALLCGWAGMAQTYTVENLGTLGGNVSRGYAINAQGSVVGSSTKADGITHAFRYSDDEGMRDLGRYTSRLQPVGSFAYGINTVGQVIGWSYSGRVTRNLPCSVRWDQNLMRNVFNCGGRTNYSHAYAINDSGQIVGQECIPFYCYALRTNPASGTRTNMTPNGVRPTAAYAINAFGHVVGIYQARGGGPGQAFLYTDENGRQDLGTLGGDTSTAYGINDDGQVVGSSKTVFGNTHAFLWTDEGMTDMTDLGVLLGDSDSVAKGINNAGTIVGYSSRGQITRAFIYTDNDGMQDLNDLIDEPGWILQAAEGINEDGQIVGYGIYNGQVRAFRLTPAK